jgi:Flp pilus assembly protein TadD
VQESPSRRQLGRPGLVSRFRTAAAQRGGQTGARAPSADRCGRSEGEALRNLGKLAAARAAFGEALGLFEAQGMRDKQALAQIVLAVALLDQGKTEGARVAAERALDGCPGTRAARHLELHWPKRWTSPG